MAFNFPANPSDGDTYEGYVYDSIAGVWNAIPSTIESTGGGFVASATAPENPSEGDGWFDTNTAKSYIFYDGFWVQIGANGTLSLGDIGGVSIASPANGESLVYDGTDWVNQNVSVDVYDVGTDSTGKFALPTGTTAERPATPNAGDIRFNTETGEPEWYSSSYSSWFSFRQSPVLELEYLVIAGGGGGGSDAAGGGGAGGYRSSVIGEASGGGAVAESTIQISLNFSYDVTVGSGGAGGTVTGVDGATNGSNSIFYNITSLGGGRGNVDNLVAGSGGSGGGSGYRNTSVRASGTTNQGYSGGLGNATGTNEGFAAGGGGGASQQGIDANNSTGGNGLASLITGVQTTRAAGGGGARGTSFTTGGLGGIGGGGTGAKRSSSSATSGAVNTGSGGGGGDTFTSLSAGAGGSGTVILRYPDSLTINPSQGLTSNTFTVGNYKVTQFTAGTGTVTFS